jgi:hypothetical protein
MKRLILTFLIVVFCTIIFAQNPNWLWARGAGSIDQDKGLSIVTDSQNYQYVTGSFRGIAFFDSTSFTSQGLCDIFVAKLDADGNYLWVVQVGGMGIDEGKSITVDNYCNIYLTGVFFGSVVFGSTELISNGGEDIFIAKLDSNGNWLWARQAGGTEYFESGTDIAVDNESNVYVTGGFRGTAVFGNITLTSSIREEIFITKLDSNGNWIWVRQAGGTDTDHSVGITTDSNGNCFITGCFSGNSVFGSTTLTSVGGKNTFVVKLDTNGNWIWVRQALGGNSESLGIDIDNDGNSYITGAFYSTVHFGSFSLSNNPVVSGYDIFTAKLDSEGNWLWATQNGGTGHDAGICLSVDGLGNSYVTGSFQETVIFGSIMLSSNGSTDIFIAKLDTSGNSLWARQGGGMGADQGLGIAVNTNSTYVIGGFQDTIIFDTTILSSYGSTDIFVAKLSNTVEVTDNTAPELTLSCLYNAYPNPSHQGQTAVIKTHTTQSEIGYLSIHNLKGQLKKDYILPAGYHETYLDTRDLAAGIYFYCLTTPTTRVAKKLVLLK